jgi:Fe-S oxidoreductase
VLKPFDRQLQYCAFCPKLCRCACPVSNVEARETVTPQQKMQTLHLLHRGQLEWSRDLTAVLYACAACRACYSYCKHPVDVGPALLAGRAAAVAQGVGHPLLVDFDFTFRYRLPKLHAAARATLPKERFADEAEVAYYPGCEAVANAPADVIRTLEVLDRLGADYLRLFDGPELCAGYPLWAAGYPDAFRAHAERVARAFARYRKIVCGCPACVHALRHRFPEVGVRLETEIIDLTEFLEGFVGRLPVKRQIPELFFHDPCYLGRFGGNFDGPRRVLDALTPRRYEFSRNRGDSVCCGGGGLLPRTAPDTAAAMAEARLGEVVEAGVTMVATPCPTCKRRLGGAAARLTERGEAAPIEVLDLIDVLERATR